MSELALHKDTYRRAIIAGDEKLANEAERFLLREYKRQGVDYNTAMLLNQRTLDEAIKSKDSSIVGNFFKGVGSGAVGLGETAALGIAALQEEEDELKSREKIQDFFSSYKPTGYDEDSISAKIGSGIGSILALAPAAAAGKFALPIAGAVSVAAGAGEASERARAAGATEEERGTAALLGSVVGISEIAPLGRMFKPFEIKFLDKLIKVADPQVITRKRDRLFNMGKTGTAEGLQEFGAAIAQNAIENGYNPEQLLVDYQAAEEGGIGAAAGAILQGVIDTVMPGRRGVRAEEGTEQAGPTTADIQAEIDSVTPIGDKPDDEQVRDELGAMFDENGNPITISSGEDLLDLDEQIGRQKAPNEDEVARLMASVDEKAEADQQELDDLDLDIEEAQMGLANLAGQNRTPQQAKQVDERLQGFQAELDERQAVNEPDAVEERKLNQALANLSKVNKPAQTAEPTPVDPAVEERRAQERAENEQANRGLVAGEQPDMFARERSQDFAGTMQRKGEQDRAQQAEIEAAQEEALMADMFDEDAASNQGELDLEKVIFQPSLDLKDPNDPEDVEIINLLNEPTIRPEDNRPEPPTNESDPQGRLDFDAEPEVAAEAPTGTPGVNPPRNQSRRVKKELNRGQQQRQRRKDKQAAAKARMQELIAQRKAARAKPTSEPVSTGTPPEQAPVSPVATAVQQGVQGMQQPAPAQPTQAEQPSQPTQEVTTAVPETDTQDAPAQETSTPQEKEPASGPKTPEYKGETYAELMRNYNQSGLRMMARKMGLPAASTTPKQTLASSITKAAKDKKDETKPSSTGGKTSTAKPTKTSPAKPKVAKPEAKKVRPAARKDDVDDTAPTPQQQAKNVTEPRDKTPANVEIAEPTRTRSQADIEAAVVSVTNEAVGSKKVSDFRADLDLVALNDYAQMDNPLDMIAFDLAREGKVKDRRKSKDDLTDDVDADTQLSDTAAAEARAKGKKIDDTVWGTTPEKAKKAVAALEKLGQKDIVAEIKRRMKSDDILFSVRVQRNAEAKYSETGNKLSASERIEINQLTKSINLRKDELVDLNADIAALENKKKKSKEDGDRLNELKGDRRAIEGIISSAEATIKQIKSDIKNLPVSALNETETDVALPIRRALINGDLQGALDMLVDSIESPLLKRFARLLAKNVGTTKVKVFKNLTSKDGTDAAGFFDPETNTISLDIRDGMNTHTIMHEMLHAITSATLADRKGSALARQLNKIYEDVKDKLDGEYGATNLDEFVAEAFSNPEFQKKLATLKADGSNIPAWKRFLNTIINSIRTRFGGEAKPLDSVLTEMDNLVMSIAHPAPRSRIGNQLLMESSQADADIALSRQGRMDKEIMDRVKSRRSWVDSTTDFFNFIPSVATKVFSRILQMQGLADLAQYNGLGDIGHRMLKTFNSYRGAQELKDEMVEKATKALGKRYNALSDKQRTLYNEFIYNEDYGATISQVDIDDSRAEYSNPEQKEAYDWLTDQWNLMDKETQKLYDDTRKFFADQRADVERALSNRISEAVQDGGAEVDIGLQKKLTKQLIEDTRLKVYFPLVRQGDNVVSFDIRDDKAQIVEMTKQFDSPADAKAYAAELRKAKGVSNVRESARSNQAPSLKDIPPSSFMYDIINKLKGSGVPDSAISDVVDVYINTLPESSMAKSYKKRKGVAGYIKDVNFALNTKGYQTGQQIVRLEHVREVGLLKSQLDTQFKEMDKSDKGRTTVQNKIKEELDARANFVLNGAKNKEFDNFIKNVNQTAFVFTIGFNTASAIVNLSQVPMVAFPMLAGKYKDSAGAAITEAMAIVGTSRKASTAEGTGSKILDKASIAHGIDSYYDITVDKNGEYTAKVRKDLDLGLKGDALKARMKQLEDLKVLVLEAKKQGQLTNSYLKEALGLEEGGKEVESSLWNKFTGLSAGMFSQAERFNRQVTLIATYNLEYKKLLAEYKKTMGDAKAINQARKDAAQTAIEFTQRVNGGSTLETASGYSQEGIGRLALMYKNYGIQMYTMMFQTGRNAVLELYKGDPKKRKEAVRQIVGLHASALMFSGVYGMPLYGSVALAYDLLVKDEDEDDFDTLAQSYMNQGMFRGGVNATLELMGADIDAGVRMRMTDLLLQENKFNPNPNPEERIGGVIGGVGLSIGKRFLRGIDDTQEGNYGRAVEQFVPASIANILKPFRYEREDGIRTRRQDLIYGDLTAGEVASQVIGFAPEQYLRTQEKNRRVKNLSEAIQKKASSLTKKYYLALRTNNYGALRDINQQIVEFNRRNPLYSLTPEKIEKSIQGHLRTSENMYNGVSINKTMREFLATQNEDILDSMLFPNR